MSNYENDNIDHDLMLYLNTLEDECARLRSALPTAIDMQWEAPPNHGGRSHGRSARPDPTGNVATDSARLNLRYQLRCSTELLKNAVINVRGVRRGLERRLTPYMGPDEG